MKKHQFIGLLICLGLIFIFSSCKKEKDCDYNQKVVISETEYKNAPNDPGMKIVNMEIVGDCLKIKFNSSGCSGSSWVVKLIDRGDLIKTNPPQRTLILSLYNTEMCEALIHKEVSFNIKDLQVEGTKKVELNISGESILYRY